MGFDSDIVIVGGGLNGAALALACAKGGLASVVVDRLPAEVRSADRFDGRSYALSAASRRLLSALGLWDGLAADAQPMLEIKASDGRPGEGAAPFFLHFDHAELEEGPMGWMVEDRHLRRALLAAMEAEPLVDHRPGETVVAQDVAAHRVDVHLESGARIGAPLLVGADGKASGTAVRAGIGRTGRNYGQTALVCAVAHEMPHHGCAHQFFMPGGPLAILPLTGNRASIVWSERRALAQHVASLDDAGFLAALRPRFGDFLGAVELAGDRYSYPLALSLATRITGTRLALVGDAAQAVHPIAGQGLNQGLRDVGTLAEVLAAAHRRGEDVGSAPVLERHRRWRSFDRATLALATDGFNRLFSNDNPLLRLGRDLGMGAIGRLPGLRRRFMREAAGLSGDVPRLLRGEPL
ncbi:MAG: 2-octaprenyl-6-methoxyphenyl hydroxylase [Deinococcus-Thermus bacterium]|jgi:2-octaprenyl-6-methoxyphenol hydroxylase|nr:2-octaprenyl-6-methoxyphenyl hydroxylase [Deinococcota bacterium]